MVGGDKKQAAIFFAKKWRNEDVSLLFTLWASCRIAAIAKALHSKGAAFSSLPRRVRWCERTAVQIMDSLLLDCRNAYSAVLQSELFGCDTKVFFEFFTEKIAVIKSAEQRNHADRFVTVDELGSGIA